MMHTSERFTGSGGIVLHAQVVVAIGRAAGDDRARTRPA